MILWTIISFGMFYGSFWGNSATTRRRCSIGLAVWLIASMALMLNGIDPHGVD